MADERLLDFPAKTTPVPADIIYVGDSADSFEEVKSTIEEIISAYPALISIAELTTVANQMIYTTGANTYATTSLTVFARSLLDDASASAARTTLGLEIGVNVQAYSLALANIAALTTVANNLIYTTAADTYAVIAPVNSALLISSVAGVPSWANTGIPAFTMGGAINMNSNLITNGATPVSSGDLTTKQYVDNLVQNVHPACDLASTVNIAATYDNGASGVGSTLTTGSATLNLDGVAVVNTDRVLIKNQSSQLENGIYDVSGVGVDVILTRSTDYDQAADMQAGDKFAVVGGNTQSATEWMMTQTAAITVGTTAITFAEMGQVTQALTAVAQQVLTVGSGTFTPATNALFFMVEGWGAGGGSGGVAGTAAETGCSGAGGGAGYFRKLFTAAEMGADAAYTVGAGGTAGAAGNNNGGAGNATTFNPAGTGATLTANGGGAGLGTPSTAGNLQAASGAGGTASNGDVNINGGTANQGIVIGGVTAGGSIPALGGMAFGTPPVGNPGNQVGTPGLTPGGGASSSQISGAGNIAGAAGGDGLIVVTEYISTSA